MRDLDDINDQTNPDKSKWQKTDKHESKLVINVHSQQQHNHYRNRFLHYTTPYCRHSMSLLFRPEALAAKSNLWLGNVRITQPIGYALTGLTGLSVAVVLGLFGAFGTYTKKATVIGQLAPATTPILWLQTTA